MPVTHAQAGPAAPGVRPGGPFQFEARDASVKALAELRALVRGIHPPVLADRGLADAIRALALDAPARISLASELDGRPPAPVESAAYFAVSELLANVSKHAEGPADLDRHPARRRDAADRCHRQRPRGADPGRGSGLRGIERRLAAFDGVLAISRPPGGRHRDGPGGDRALARPQHW